MLKKINLKRERGLPFFMAFCYLPGEVKILTGDLGTIRDYAQKELPICHAYIVAYNKGGINKLGYEIIGKGSQRCFVSKTKRGKRYSYFNDKTEYNPRTYYELYYREKTEKQSRVVAKYRKMPKQYLRYFKENT